MSPTPLSKYKGNKKASTVVMLNDVEGDYDDDSSSISLPPPPPPPPPSTAVAESGLKSSIKNNQHPSSHNTGSSVLKFLKTRNHYLKCFVAELFATWLFLTIGFCAHARHELAERPCGGDPIGGLGVTLSFAIGCGIAILIVGKVSGAHVNPAVSFSVFLTGQLKPFLFFVYFLAQLLGSFLAATTVFLVYFDNFDSHSKGIFSAETLRVFIPLHHEAVVSIPLALFESTLATSVLIWPLQALADKRNEQHPPGVTIILIVLILIAIPLALGHHAGLFINPVADLGPRLFALVVGWGSQTFTSNHFTFWIPLVGPMLGSLFASLTYKLIISNNW